MEKHNVIIKSSKYRRMHEFCWWRPVVESSKKLIENVDVWAGEINEPLLEVGDYLYIKELNTKIQIEEKVRSTDGGYVYYTDDLSEVIEDELTEKSLEKANKEFEDHIKKQEAQRKNNKKWYKFWK
ncbi:hypothetical protein COE51_01570 [Bacillus pseudomycoides]|nr:hypothetical protein COE51_01570 [Bacillus pseudomycoides]